MQASIQFVGWNFDDVERWCNFYCIPIVGKTKNARGEVESFFINAEREIIEINKGDIIQFECSEEVCKIDKKYFANYD